jgi:hypothetical protein
MSRKWALIDGIQTVGNSFILDLIDLNCAISHRGEAQNRVFQSNDT